MTEGSCSVEASLAALAAFSANAIFTAVAEDVALTAVSANVILTAFAEDVVTSRVEAAAEDVVVALTAVSATANPMANTCCQDLSMANSS